MDYVVDKFVRAGLKRHAVIVGTGGQTACGIIREIQLLPGGGMVPFVVTSGSMPSYCSECVKVVRNAN